MTLAEINPLGELEDGTFVALDAHMDMENEARPRQKALLAELGVGDEETRQAREATAFELAGEAVDAHGPPRRGRQRHRVRRRPRPRHRRRRRLADAVRRGPRPRRQAGQLLRDRRQPVGARRPAAWPSSCCQKPGVDKIAVMMSIVSNTRVDIVARGVIKACLELGYDPAEKIAIFRIPGAWEEEGFKILERYGVRYADRSVSLQRGRQPRGAKGRPAMSILIDAEHDVHRPGHHRARGRQPHPRVPRLRRRREGRRRRHARPAGPRRPRRAGLRHRRARPSSTTAGRSTARSSPSRPPSPRTRSSRRSPTASS